MAKNKVEEIQKNSIALAFDGFGVLSHTEDWFCSDYLDANYPAMVEKIKNSNCQEVAERLIVDLINQIAMSASGEKERVLSWLEGLRQIKEDRDLRTLSERPSLNRGFVTE